MYAIPYIKVLYNNKSVSYQPCISEKQMAAYLHFIVSYLPYKQIKSKNFMLWEKLPD